MDTITWSEFEKIHLMAGTIITASPFPEAHRPAYKLEIDLGDSLGVKQSSAQITTLYSIDDLIGKQVLCVVNFPSKQIGPFISQILTTGFVDGEDCTLCIPDKPVPNGTRLF